MPTFARPIALSITVALAVLVAAPVAQATPLPLAHQTVSVSDTPNDGVVAPGDTLLITETLHNTDISSPLTGLTATLTSSTPGVSVTSGTSSYPDIPANGTGANTTPFQVTLSPTQPCGTTLNFSLTVTSAAGTAVVPFSVVAGATGAFVDYSGFPAVIGDASPTLRPRVALMTYSGTASISNAGVVKDVRVVVGDLAHPDISHLGLDLVAPDGTRTTLVDHRGAAGGTFSETQLMQGAATAVAAAASPFTGSFRPDGDFGVFVGTAAKGPWRLAVSASDPSEIGRLNRWTLRVATGDCTPRSLARLSLSAPRIDPGGSATLDASQSESVAPGGITRYEYDYGNGTFADGIATQLHSFPTRGRYTVRVRVSDAGGVIGIASEELIVSQAPIAQLVLPGTDPKEMRNVDLDGSGSYDPDGSAITRYDWDIDGDDDFDDASGATPSPYFATSGPHTIKLRVTDADGATGMASAVLNVLATMAPTPAISATPNPVLTGAAVLFDASASSDADGTIVGYEWDLDGNGSFETPGGASPFAGRSYPNATVLSVGVRVTDNDLRTAVARIALTIQAPAGAPPTQGPGDPFAGTPAGGSAGGGGVGSGGGQDGSDDGGDGGHGGETLAASLAGASIQGLKLVTKKGLGLRCTADRAATCSVTATLQPADARKLGLSKSRKNAYVLGRATAHLSKAGAATITVRVAPKALARLKRTPRVTVLVTGTAVDAAGGKVTLRRAVLLRR